VLHLQEAYSLSVLMYAAPALTLRSKEIDELNACWNSVIRRLFGYKRTESVKDVICGLGRMNVRHLVLLRKVKFYKRLYYKNGLLHDVLWVFLLSNGDECLKTVLFNAFSC
jgi:hypothetical protein